MAEIASAGARRRRRLNSLQFLPPAGRSSLAWAFDPAYGYGEQTHPSIIGPAGILGSTTGVDANDPTLVVPSPTHYSLGVDDYLNFGDNFDATFQGTFTLQAAVDLAAGDVGAVTRGIIDKSIAIELRLVNGVYELYTYYEDAFAKYDGWHRIGALGAGKHIFTVTRDPALARAARVLLYLAGAVQAKTNSVVGTDSTIANTANPVRYGLNLTNGYVPVSKLASVYLWSSVLSAAEILANAQWTQNRGWV